MKLLLIMLSLSLSLPESRVDRIPQSNSSYSECDARAVASGLWSESKFPRSSLFHYGKRELLLKDVNLGNVPESDWNDFIMGEKTRFKLKRFRRGFYGTEYLEDADRFGDANYNWLVEIKLNPECLKPNRLVSLVYLTKSTSFKNWYESKSYPKNFNQWSATCFDAAAYPRYNFFINYKNESESADFSESDCEKVVGDYYEEKKIGIVHDYAGDLVRSWAIRDRECISTVNGSDGYWSKEFAKRIDFWTNTCNFTRNHRNNIRVWFMAMKNAGFESPLIGRFSKMLLSIKAPEDQNNWESQESDRFAAQDFAKSLFEASQRCTGTREKNLREALGEISLSVDQLNSDDVKTKLESLCQ